MKKRMMIYYHKRSAAILLVMMFLLVLLSISGCSNGQVNNTEPKKTKEYEGLPVVRMCLPTTYDMSLKDQVQDALNRVSAEKYGFIYELQYIPFGNYLQQVNLILSDEGTDVFMGGLGVYYHNGLIADLNSYWESEDAAPFRNIWGEDYMKAMRIDGHVYGIPHLVDFGHYLSLNIDSEIAMDLGIRSEQEISIDDVDEILQTIHEKYPDRVTLGGAGSVIGGFYTWDTLSTGTNNAVGVISGRGQSDLTVHSIFDDEDYISLANKARNWYEAGYIEKDILSIQEPALTAMLQDKAASCFDMYGVNYIPGVTRTRIREVGNWMPSANIAASVYMISSRSKHPETAFRALQAIYCDPEIDILFNSGVEGLTYVRNDDGTISYPDGKTAADSGWAAPTMYWNLPGGGNSYPLQENGTDFFDRLRQFNNESERTRCSGFCFDETPVYDEYRSCQAVLAKYYTALLSGAVPVQESLEQARTEMKEAGEDIVIAEKQRQLDEFMSIKE